MTKYLELSVSKDVSALYCRYGPLNMLQKLQVPLQRFNLTVEQMEITPSSGAGIGKG